MEMTETLDDLNYADDICLLSYRCADMQRKISALHEEAKTASLKINKMKTKELRLHPKTQERLQIEDQIIKR